MDGLSATLAETEAQIQYNFPAPNMASSLECGQSLGIHYYAKTGSVELVREAHGIFDQCNRTRLAAVPARDRFAHLLREVAPGSRFVLVGDRTGAATVFLDSFGGQTTIVCKETVYSMTHEGNDIRPSLRDVRAQFLPKGEVYEIESLSDIEPDEAVNSTVLVVLPDWSFELSQLDGAAERLFEFTRRQRGGCLAFWLPNIDKRKAVGRRVDNKERDRILAANRYTNLAQRNCNIVMDLLKVRARGYYWHTRRQGGWFIVEKHRLYAMPNQQQAASQGVAPMGAVRPPMPLYEYTGKNQPFDPPLIPSLLSIIGRPGWQPTQHTLSYNNAHVLARNAMLVCQMLAPEEPVRAFGTRDNGAATLLRLLECDADRVYLGTEVHRHLESELMDHFRDATVRNCGGETALRSIWRLGQAGLREMIIEYTSPTDQVKRRSMQIGQQDGITIDAMIMASDLNNDDGKLVQFAILDVVSDPSNNGEAQRVADRIQDIVGRTRQRFLLVVPLHNRSVEEATPFDAQVFDRLRDMKESCVSQRLGKLTVLYVFAPEWRLKQNGLAARFRSTLGSNLHFEDGFSVPRLPIVYWQRRGHGAMRHMQVGLRFTEPGYFDQLQLFADRTLQRPWIDEATPAARHVRALQGRDPAGLSDAELRALDAWEATLLAVEGHQKQAARDQSFAMRHAQREEKKALRQEDEARSRAAVAALKAWQESKDASLKALQESKEAERQREQEQDEEFYYRYLVRQRRQRQRQRRQQRRKNQQAAAPSQQQAGPSKGGMSIKARQQRAQRTIAAGGDDPFSPRFSGIDAPSLKR